jgi:hypothetical protein
MKRGQSSKNKYPEFKGKVVSFIRESQTDDEIGIVVEFTDKTAMTWTVRPRQCLRLSSALSGAHNSELADGKRTEN